MSQKNNRSFSNSFSHALIFAGLFACQPVVIHPSEPPASEKSPVSASPVPIAFENRKANIFIKKVDGNRYQFSWPPIPGAAYYKLFLDGQLLKEPLKTSQYQMDILDLRRDIHKLGYEVFDASNRLIGYLAQEWDLRSNSDFEPIERFLPKIPALLELTWEPVKQAQYYRLFLNERIHSQGFSQNRASLTLNDLMGINFIALEAFNSENQMFQKLLASFEEPLVLPGKQTLHYPNLKKIILESGNPFRFSHIAPETVCAMQYPISSDLDAIAWLSGGDNLSGKIYTDQHQLLENVKIEIRHIKNFLPFFDETYTKTGNYEFPCNPSGIVLEIKATKPGFTTRIRHEVLTGNKHGDPNSNRHDFGTDNDPLTENFSASYNALSDKPEVTFALPNRNQKRVSANTDFVLTFSEPMNRQAVEDNFTIRAFTPRKLSVDSSNNPATLQASEPQPRPLPFGLEPNPNLLPNYNNLTQFQTGTSIYDSSAFEISWNADDTQVTFAFKPGKALPTDRDPARLPIYALAFDSLYNHQRGISDKTGVTRTEKHFKLTDGDFEEALIFEVQPDQIPPRLLKMERVDVPARILAFRLTFSEPMLLRTHTLMIAGGMGDTLNSCLQAAAGYPKAKKCHPAQVAANYMVTVKSSQGQIKFHGLWSEWGGEAQYDFRDPSFKTVVLSTSQLPFIQAAGDQYSLEVAASLRDPAGKPMDPSARMQFWKPSAGTSLSPNFEHAF